MPMVLNNALVTVKMLIHVHMLKIKDSCGACNRLDSIDSNNNDCLAVSANLLFGNMVLVRNVQ